MNTFRAAHTEFLVNVCLMKREHILQVQNDTNSVVAKDKIYRMSIKGCKDFTQDMSTKAHVEPHRQKRLTATSSTTTTTSTMLEQVLIKKPTVQMPMPNNNNNNNYNKVENVNCIDAAASTDERFAEPVYAVIDLENKAAHRKMRNLNFISKRCNSYDSIIQNNYQDEQDETQRTERIQNTQSIIKSSNNIEENAEAIYEDGEELNTFFCPRTDEENIYEPINITTSQPNPSFWSYFNRLKLNSILQLTRIRKMSGETKTAKLNGAGAAANTSMQTMDLKRKCSNNRKSIKLRMRKFCFREYEPKPFFKHPTQQQPTQQTVGAATEPIAAVSKPKSRWKSVKLGRQNQNVLSDVRTTEKRLFGSLPHLRKPRTSLFSSQNFFRPNETEAAIAASAESKDI